MYILNKGQKKLHLAYCPKMQEFFSLLLPFFQDFEIELLPIQPQAHPAGKQILERY